MTTKIEAKHTPGPWVTDESPNDYEGAFIQTDDKIVAKICTENCTMVSAEEKANTRLIAAAPELLKELKLRHQNCECQNIPENNDCSTYLLIRKAEGK